MGAYEILKQLDGRGVRSPLQVYRALDQLTADGFVRRLESISAYALVSAEARQCDEAVAYAICSVCGLVEEILPFGIRDELTRLAVCNGFSFSAVNVELSGICKHCNETEHTHRPGPSSK